MNSLSAGERVMATVQEWDEGAFQANVNSPAVLVDFFASWCGPCKMMMQLLEKTVAELDDDAVEIAKIDIEKCPELAARFKVHTVPTFVFFKNGEVQETLVGVQSRNSLNEAFRKIME